MPVTEASSEALANPGVRNESPRKENRALGGRLKEESVKHGECEGSKLNAKFTEAENRKRPTQCPVVLWMESETDSGYYASSLCLGNSLLT